MQNNGLSFLLNLNGNNALNGEEAALGAPSTASTPADVKTFFTLHELLTEQGVVKGAESPPGALRDNAIAAPSLEQTNLIAANAKAALNPATPIEENNARPTKLSAVHSFFSETTFLNEVSTLQAPQENGSPAIVPNPHEPDLVVIGNAIDANAVEVEAPDAGDGDVKAATLITPDSNGFIEFGDPLTEYAYPGDAPLFAAASVTARPAADKPEFANWPGVEDGIGELAFLKRSQGIAAAPSPLQSSAGADLALHAQASAQPPSQQQGDALSAMRIGEANQAAMLRHEGAIVSNIKALDRNAETVEPALVKTDGPGRAMTAPVHGAPAIASMAIAAGLQNAERHMGDQQISMDIVDGEFIGSSSAIAERASGQIPAMQSHAATTAAQAAWGQVVSAISARSGDGKLELRLDPPELGRVVISFESQGGDLVRAVVSADTPQTLDLMRRHLDILNRELERSGLGDVNVELGDQQTQDAPPNADERTIAYLRGEETPSLLDDLLPTAPVIADGRLDLRI